MRKIGLFFFTAAILAGHLSRATQPNSLTIDDLAPKITAPHLLQGPQINELAPGKVYVVEFWATTCGPCIHSIPHLNELAAKWNEKIQIVALAGEENRGSVEGDIHALKSFLLHQHYSEKISVAQIGIETVEAWQDASSSFYVPNAFIVDQDGKIAWIGHPDDLDEPLEKIIHGKWDRSAARAEHSASFAEGRNEQAYRVRREELRKESRWEDILHLTREYLSELPSDSFHEFHIFYLTLTEMLIKLGRIDEAAHSIDPRWGDEYPVQEALEYSSQLIGHPAFQAIARKNLNRFREFVHALLQREDLMKNYGYQYTLRLANIEMEIGDKARATELYQQTLPFLPKETIRVDECVGGVCALPRTCRDELKTPVDSGLPAHRGIATKIGDGPA
jgi:thiol-disulfide isomerase/thioredoxin